MDSDRGATTDDESTEYDPSPPHDRSELEERGLPQRAKSRHATGILGACICDDPVTVRGHFWPRTCQNCGGSIARSGSGNGQEILPEDAEQYPDHPVIVDAINVHEFEADDRGRVTLGADYAGRTVRVAVLDGGEADDEPGLDWDISIEYSGDGDDHSALGELVIDGPHGTLTASKQYRVAADDDGPEQARTIVEETEYYHDGDAVAEHRTEWRGHEDVLADRETFVGGCREVLTSDPAAEYQQQAELLAYRREDLDWRDD